MLVALSGYGGVGKDSVADVLVADYGFKRYAWADTLRLAAEALNPMVDLDQNLRTVRYKDAVERVGYNEAKFQYPEVRRILQRLGTEVGRNLISDSVWVDATLRRIRRECDPWDDIVITDTRFNNEVAALKDPEASPLRGPVLAVRVNRPGIGPAGEHSSETDLDNYDFDYTIDNNGTLDDLPGTVEEFLKDIEISRFELRLF